MRAALCPLTFVNGGSLFQKDQQNQSRWENCMLGSLNKVQCPSLTPATVIFLQQ